MIKITFKNQAGLAITCADCLFLVYQVSAQDALEDDLRSVCQLIASKKAAKRWVYECIYNAVNAIACCLWVKLKIIKDRRKVEDALFNNH